MCSLVGWTSRVHGLLFFPASPNNIFCFAPSPITTPKSPFAKSSQDPDQEALISDSESGGSVADKYLPTLSKKQRIIGFVTCLGLGLFFFSFATVYLPVMVLKARKFALMFSLGSLFTLGSFSFLWGPFNHIKHLFGRERLPFTAVYFGTLFFTLYFALSLQSYVLTSVAAVAQVGALLWFVISYVPGGQTGMKFFARICSAMCFRQSSAGANVLPI